MYLKNSCLINIPSWHGSAGFCFPLDSPLIPVQQSSFYIPSCSFNSCKLNHIFKAKSQQERKKTAVVLGATTHLWGMCRNVHPSACDSHTPFPRNLSLKENAMFTCYCRIKTRSKWHKGSLCCSGMGHEDSLEVSLLLSHTAWHAALISSGTDASGPRQTDTQPERREEGVNYRYTSSSNKHLHVCGRDGGLPFLIPKRKGMLFSFRASFSSSGLQKKHNYNYYL